MSSRQTSAKIDVSESWDTSETKCKNIFKWDIKLMETEKTWMNFYVLKMFA